MRNPRGAAGSIKSLTQEAIIPALIGGAGAVVTGVVMGYVQPSLPTTLQTGWFNVLAQAGAAIGLGLIARRFLGRARGDMVMVGALTVTAYSALNSLVSGLSIPGLTSSSTVSDYTPFRAAPARIGAYMPGTPNTSGFRRLGYISPAPVLGPALSPSMSGMGAYMSPMNVAPWSNDGM